MPIVYSSETPRDDEEMLAQEEYAQEEAMEEMSEEEIDLMLKKAVEKLEPKFCTCGRFDRVKHKRLNPLPDYCEGCKKYAKRQAIGQPINN